jgi:hypothetical protein
MPPTLITIEFGSYPNLSPADVAQARRKIRRWMSIQGLHGHLVLQAEVNDLRIQLRGLLETNASEKANSLGLFPGAVSVESEVLNSPDKARRARRRMRSWVTGSPTQQQRLMLRHALGPDPRRMAK